MRAGNHRPFAPPHYPTPVPGVGGPPVVQDEEPMEEAQVPLSRFINDSDFYARSTQLLMTASRSLYHKKKQIQKTENGNEDMLERYPGNPIHNHAFIDQIYREILNYTRCLTYWTYTTLCNQTFIKYHRDDQPRFGIKPAMKYTNNKFLMSLATVIEGRAYDWKMDFTGSDQFPHTLNNKDNVESLLREMYSIIWAYSNKMNAKQNFRATKQNERGQHARPIHVPHQEKDLSNSLNTLRSIISEVCDKIRNNTGGILWEKKNTMDLSGRFSGEEKHSVFEVDGDVTYNPQQRIKFAFMGVSNHGKNSKLKFSNTFHTGDQEVFM